MAMQITGQIIGGIEQDKAAHAQARVDDANAQRTLLAGEQQALQTRKDERRASGDMIAGMGGTGLMIGSGSAADVLAQNAYERELEILNIRTQSATNANNLYQAGADKRAAGKAALVQSIYGAASTAIAGAGQMRASRTISGANDAYRAASLGGGTQSVPQPRIGGGGY